MIRQVPICGCEKNLSYLITDLKTKEIVIVDPGYAQQLIAEIEIEGYIPKAILLTHSHFDHFEGAFNLVEKYNLPIYIHENGLEAVKSFGILALGLKSKFVLNDTEILPFYTPGHTMDSVCFYVPKYKSLITGDTVFIGSVGKVSSVSNMKQLYNSISMIRKLPSDTIILPGHDYGNRPVGRIINERKNNEFLKARNFFVFSKLFGV
jgi:glyoxylase-like metal-dependent hydrolase (beta-lactamase superfamily II)